MSWGKFCHLAYTISSCTGTEDVIGEGKRDEPLTWSFPKGRQALSKILPDSSTQECQEHLKELLAYFVGKKCVIFVLSYLNPQMSRGVCVE